MSKCNVFTILQTLLKNAYYLADNQDEPVQPKYDVNAPDLCKIHNFVLYYFAFFVRWIFFNISDIPTMAYATYILLVGYILGLRNAFSPDSLATTASSALVWLILEIGVIYLTLTIMNINTSLTKWDILAFSSYKYVGIIAVLISGLLLSTKGYYIGLIYVSVSFMFFLLRTLKLRIEPEVIMWKQIFTYVVFHSVEISRLFYHSDFT